MNVRPVTSGFKPARVTEKVGFWLIPGCPDEESFRKVLTSGNQLLTLPGPGDGYTSARSRACALLPLFRFNIPATARVVARAPALFSPPSLLPRFPSARLPQVRSKTSFNSPIQVYVAGRKLAARSGHRHRMKSSEPESEILWGINV